MGESLLPTKILWISGTPGDELLAGPLDILTLTQEEQHGLLPFAIVRIQHDADSRIVNQEIKLGPLTMYFHEVTPLSNMILFPKACSQNVILHVMLGHNVRVLMGNGHLTELRNQRMDLFNLDSDWHTVPLEQWQNFNSFHINFQPDRAEELMAAYPELRGLLTDDILQGEGQLYNGSIYFNEVCQWSMKAILNCKQIEETAEYFLRRQAVNILTVYLRTMKLSPEAFRMSTKCRKKTAACFHYLRVNAAERHTTEDLAKRFLLDPQVLEECFTARYGRTIREFILDRRMDIAYKSLMFSKANFATIAALTGFDSVAAFRIAFRRYYKEEPVFFIKGQ